MKYTDTMHERKSDSNYSFNSNVAAKKANVMKRVLLLMVATFMLFAGAQSLPASAAGSSCDMSCSEPYIDPSDGQCYITCCPSDSSMKCPCERRLCK